MKIHNYLSYFLNIFQYICSGEFELTKINFFIFEINTSLDFFYKGYITISNFVNSFISSSDNNEKESLDLLISYKKNINSFFLTDFYKKKYQYNFTLVEKYYMNFYNIFFKMEFFKINYYNEEFCNKNFRYFNNYIETFDNKIILKNKNLFDLIGLIEIKKFFVFLDLNIIENGKARICFKNFLPKNVYYFYNTDLTWLNWSLYFNNLYEPLKGADIYRRAVKREYVTAFQNEWRAFLIQYFNEFFFNYNIKDLSIKKKFINLYFLNFSNPLISENITGAAYPTLGLLKKSNIYSYFYSNIEKLLYNIFYVNKPLNFGFNFLKNHGYLMENNLKIENSLYFYILNDVSFRTLNKDYYLKSQAIYSFQFKMFFESIFNQKIFLLRNKVYKEQFLNDLQMYNEIKSFIYNLDKYYLKINNRFFTKEMFNSNKLNIEDYLNIADIQFLKMEYFRNYTNFFLSKFKSMSKMHPLIYDLRLFYLNRTNFFENCFTKINNFITQSNKSLLEMKELSKTNSLNMKKNEQLEAINLLISKNFKYKLKGFRYLKIFFPYNINNQKLGVKKILNFAMNIDLLSNNISEEINKLPPLQRDILIYKVLNKELGTTEALDSFRFTLLNYVFKKYTDRTINFFNNETKAIITNLLIEEVFLDDKISEIQKEKILNVLLNTRENLNNNKLLKNSSLIFLESKKSQSLILMKKDILSNDLLIYDLIRGKKRFKDERLNNYFLNKIIIGIVEGKIVILDSKLEGLVLSKLIEKLNLNKLSISNLETAKKLNFIWEEYQKIYYDIHEKVIDKQSDTLRKLQKLTNMRLLDKRHSDELLLNTLYKIDEGVLTFGSERKNRDFYLALICDMTENKYQFVNPIINEKVTLFLLNKILNSEVFFDNPDSLKMKKAFDFSTKGVYRSILENQLIFENKKIKDISENEFNERFKIYLMDHIYCGDIVLSDETKQRLDDRYLTAIKRGGGYQNQYYKKGDEINKRLLNFIRKGVYNEPFFDYGVVNNWKKIKKLDYNKLIFDYELKVDNYLKKSISYINLYGTKEEKLRLGKYFNNYIINLKIKQGFINELQLLELKLIKKRRTEKFIIASFNVGTDLIKNLSFKSKLLNEINFLEENKKNFLIKNNFDYKLNLLKFKNQDIGFVNVLSLNKNKFAYKQISLFDYVISDKTGKLFFIKKYPKTHYFVPILYKSVREDFYTNLNLIDFFIIKEVGLEPYFEKDNFNSFLTKNFEFEGENLKGVRDFYNLPINIVKKKKFVFPLNVNLDFLKKEMIPVVFEQKEVFDFILKLNLKGLEKIPLIHYSKEKFFLNYKININLEMYNQSLFLFLENSKVYKSINYLLDLDKSKLLNEELSLFDFYSDDSEYNKEKKVEEVIKSFGEKLEVLNKEILEKKINLDVKFSETESIKEHDPRDFINSIIKENNYETFEEINKRVGLTERSLFKKEDFFKNLESRGISFDDEFRDLSDIEDKYSDFSEEDIDEDFFDDEEYSKSSDE